MDLFEYQGKSLYENFDIAHPNSHLINKIEDLEEDFTPVSYTHLTLPTILRV